MKVFRIDTEHGMNLNTAYDILVEAIDFSDYGSRKAQRKALKEFKILVERATPMKVILKGYEFLCLKCNGVVGYHDGETDYANYRDKFCFECGQKLGDK